MPADYDEEVVYATIHAGITEGILEVRWVEGERQCRPVDKFRNSDLMLSLSRPLIHSAVRKQQAEHPSAGHAASNVRNMIAQKCADGRHDDQPHKVCLSGKKCWGQD